MISEFGRYIRFSLDPVTPKMMAAFPIFWNRRYEELNDGITYQDIELDFAFDGGSERFVGKRGKGLTPLELYAQLLFDEPSLNDSLCAKIRKVLYDYSHFRKNYRKECGGQNTKENARRLIAMDLVYVEFLRTKYGSDGLLDMAVRSIPAPSESGYGDREDVLARCATNGGIREFCLLIGNNDFFTSVSNDGWNELAEKAPMIPDEFGTGAMSNRDMHEEFDDRTILPEQVGNRKLRPLVKPSKPASVLTNYQVLNTRMNDTLARYKASSPTPLSSEEHLPEPGPLARSQTL
jgi:hypothetical protein